MLLLEPLGAQGASPLKRLSMELALAVIYCFEFSFWVLHFDEVVFLYEFYLRLA